MGKRYRLSRSRFYGIMSAALMALAGVNFLLGGLLLKLADSDKTDGLALLGLGFIVLLAPALYMDDRRSSCCLSRSIGMYISFVMLFGVALAVTWTCVNTAWLLIPVFVLENVLLWRYFAQHHPRPL